MRDLVYINNNETIATYSLEFLSKHVEELCSPAPAWPNEERKLDLPVLLQAETNEAFWTKFHTIISLLGNGNSISLYSSYLYRRFLLDYDSISNLNISPFGETGLVGSFTIQLIDDYPDVFSYTRTAEFTKPDTSKISFSRVYRSYSAADASALGAWDPFFTIDGQNFANTQ